MCNSKNFTKYFPVIKSDEYIAENSVWIIVSLFWNNQTSVNIKPYIWLFVCYSTMWSSKIFFMLLLLLDFVITVIYSSHRYPKYPVIKLSNAVSHFFHVSDTHITNRFFSIRMSLQLLWYYCTETFGTLMIFPVWITWSF